MMKFMIAGAALLAATGFAAGQDRVAPAPAPGVEIHEHAGPTVRHDCDTKTVHKEGPEGSKTVKKERCD